MRRTMVAVAALAAVLAGCGGDDGGDDVASCSEVWGGGQVVDETTGDQPCLDEDGGLAFYGSALTDCADGRTLGWNDVGWGYYGEPWTAHEDGAAELVAPAAEREACSG